MRPITFLLVAAAAWLTACGRYTEATSPCFTLPNVLEVSRAAQIPLSFNAPLTPVTPAAPASAQSCDFQPIGAPEE